MTTSARQSDREFIEAALAREGLTAASWRDGEDGLEAIITGRWKVVGDDDEHGLYQGDEGELAACVVGSAEYGNRRVHFGFTADGYDGANECRPFVNVEPAS